ncbi:MAG: hypothetical protein ACFFCP_15210 [Promethearchaeota archaeon]
MSRPVMFNVRLSKSESDEWLDLLDEVSIVKIRDRPLAKQFLSLPETISFVSTVKNQIIGGTTIYRDRARLSMVLVSVAVKERYRDSAAYQIIKTSLPFFRTVAIRDVDVLISQDGDSDNIGFPLSFEINPWTSSIISKIGFNRKASLQRYSFEITDKRDFTFKWDDRVDLKGAKELLWDQSERLGLANSLVWAARDFAENCGSLLTSTIDGKLAAVAGTWQRGESLVVTPFVTNPDLIEWRTAARAIIQKGVKQLHFPIVGIGQLDLIEEIKELANITSAAKLVLMRKNL